jgi:hypothetical protein
MHYQSRCICLILNFASTILFFLLYFHTFSHAYDPHTPRLLVVHPRRDPLDTIAEQWRRDKYSIAAFPPTWMGPPVFYYQHQLLTTDRIALLLNFPLTSAVVSSAGTLKDSRLGHWIDSHDIVIHLNNTPTLGHQLDVRRITYGRSPY